MMAQHTPGPWAISKHATPPHCPQFGIYAEGESNDLATVKNDNAEANARLIAAAPDLLDALQSTLEQIEAHTEPMSEQAFLDSAWHPLWTEAKAAIAKATAQ